MIISQEIYQIFQQWAHLLQNPYTVNNSTARCAGILQDLAALFPHHWKRRKFRSLFVKAQAPREAKIHFKSFNYGKFRFFLLLYFTSVRTDGVNFNLFVSMQ